MAEVVVFSLASKILSTIASPAFEKANEKGLSLWEAREELSKLHVSVETIQAVLLDAEKKQEGSAAVKNWIKRLKRVLYDADDLFDEVATEDLIKQQTVKGKDRVFSKKVWVSCCRLNPIISRNSIAKKVKAIRKSLLDISKDMNQFKFVPCQMEKLVSGMRRGQDPGCFVDAKAVIGRDEDKKAIIEMLFSDASSDFPVVIVLVGIGGMGKTTLAQLIYNDDEVKKHFAKRWFACISDSSAEKEVIGPIFQSIHEQDYAYLTVSQIQTKIRESLEGEKYLLVLDDVWDDHRGRWQDRMNLLSSGAKGSRIIVTTRLPSVVNAMNALRAHNLQGLSEEDSWDLLKRLAFIPGDENDLRRESLGREILKRCRRVPLAIWSIGSLLSEKNTIPEWEAIERKGTLGKNYNDETMSVLKLSYDHLPSNLKHCFAYCSLFPKDNRYNKQMLIHLWIAQGYIEPNSEESEFMHLLRRGFFQDVLNDGFGEIESCKMHDIMHDLALYVAGEESIVLSGPSSNTSNCTRHVSVVDLESWAIPEPLLNVKRLRSCLLMKVGSFFRPTTLDQLFTNFKLLRTLSLASLGIENIPPSIGELKLLRYIDLSYNGFKELPDSMSNLVNLMVLKLRVCYNLKVWPQNFWKLINLRYLDIELCRELKQMPSGIGELTHLHYLNNLKGVKGKDLDEWAGLLQQLRGTSCIQFDRSIDYADEEDWDGDECRWQLPVLPHQLIMVRYPGIRIPGWGNNVIGSTNNLAHLELRYCKKVKYLPPLRWLPNLIWLELNMLSELEFVEEVCTNSSSIFFLRLEELRLQSLPKLKGWGRNVVATPTTEFPSLSLLVIACCPNLELKSFPQCSILERLLLDEVDNNTPSVTQEQLQLHPPIQDITITRCKWLSSFHGGALASLECFQIISCCNLKSLSLASPQLQTIRITNCIELVSFEGTTTSLKTLTFQGCKQLKMLHISSHLNAGLEELEINDCPELELWELQDDTWPQLDWDSLSNLCHLKLHPLPPPEKLPHCLQHRQSLGTLQISEAFNYASE